jgi:hypothetical protein
MPILSASRDFAPVYQSPAGNALAVTPSDTGALSANGLQIISRGIYVGGGGHINVVMAINSATCQFASVAGGSLLPIRVTRVQQSGTTATGIIAVW